MILCLEDQDLEEEEEVEEEEGEEVGEGVDLIMFSPLASFCESLSYSGITLM